MPHDPWQYSSGFDTSVDARARMRPTSTADSAESRGPAGPVTERRSGLNASALPQLLFRVMMAPSLQMPRRLTCGTAPGGSPLIGTCTRRMKHEPEGLEDSELTWHTSGARGRRRPAGQRPSTSNVPRNLIARSGDLGRERGEQAVLHAAPGRGPKKSTNRYSSNFNQQKAL